MLNRYIPTVEDEQTHSYECYIDIAQYVDVPQDIVKDALYKQVLGAEIEPCAEVFQDLQVFGKESPERTNEEHHEHYAEGCTYSPLRAESDCRKQ